MTMIILCRNPGLQKTMKLNVFGSMTSFAFINLIDFVNKSIYSTTNRPLLSQLIEQRNQKEEPIQIGFCNPYSTLLRDCSRKGNFGNRDLWVAIT